MGASLCGREREVRKNALQMEDESTRTRNVRLG